MTIFFRPLRALLCKGQRDVGDWSMETRGYGLRPLSNKMRVFPLACWNLNEQTPFEIIRGDSGNQFVNDPSVMASGRNSWNCKSLKSIS